MYKRSLYQKIKQSMLY